MTPEQNEMLTLISARTGMFLTDEQKEFASDFTKPTISFSNPGTGKTTSMVAGLILTQTFHRVKGDHINAMSYTRDATAQLANRYEEACKRCDIKPTIQFNTFHAICRKVIIEGIGRIDIVQANEEEDIEIMSSYMEDIGLDSSDKFYVKNLIKIVNDFNSSLTFDPALVQKKYKFKKLHMEIGDFEFLRKKWFNKSIVTKTMTQGDLPLYALWILETEPKVLESFRSQYEIMVVDELQDVNILCLKVLSLIAKTLVAIGDMKQQIYGYNGACPQIVREYLKTYPNAKQVVLTKSFRCKDEISAYATAIIAPNDPSVVPFVGMGSGGSVSAIPSSAMNLSEIVAKVKNGQQNGSVRSSEVMFLFRNNFSAMPIMEEMWQQGCKFRSSKFMTVMEVPIYRELCELAQLALYPSDANILKYCIPKYFPEFKMYASDPKSCPILVAITKSGKSLLEVNYSFRTAESTEIVNRLTHARDAILSNKSARYVFNFLMPIYAEHYIKNQWWKLEYDQNYYHNLVGKIIEKPYREMYSQELAKRDDNNKNYKLGYGAKCYTVHSAKGLEADDIYLIDAEAGIFPSGKNINQYVNEQCEYEAAKLIREERNLLYVAVTRAKNNVYISYNKDLTPLLSTPNANEYSYLDQIYREQDQEFDDVTHFMRIFNVNGSAAKAEGEVISNPINLHPDVSAVDPVTNQNIGELLIDQLI